MAVQRYTEAELLAGVRAAAAELGEPLTVLGYDRHRTEHGGASGQLVVRRFGSWSAACEAAGVKANASRSWSRRWSEAELVAHVATYLASPGARGTYNDYAAWARETEGVPSGPTIRNSFPRWAELKELAERQGRS
ncbi:homing endonuclease associated repeat-containing protein [Nocardioides donggukensis]|uniref:Uncharacterized protein n=1 Tax=Nocardioides donggukensis TaxID=2774019 RepID=A0A927K5F8_9ACTN|nr:hypothetical protein [Nocardioides donggukensis]MBD8870589.1 hypothetical protein [Nocardioides donggukensis]